MLRCWLCCCGSCRTHPVWQASQSPQHNGTTRRRWHDRNSIFTEVRSCSTNSSSFPHSSPSTRPRRWPSSGSDTFTISGKSALVEAPCANGPTPSSTLSGFWIYKRATGSAFPGSRLQRRSGHDREGADATGRLPPRRANSLPAAESSGCVFWAGSTNLNASAIRITPRSRSLRNGCAGSAACPMRPYETTAAPPTFSSFGSQREAHRWTPSRWATSTMQFRQSTGGEPGAGGRYTITRSD